MADEKLTKIVNVGTPFETMIHTAGVTETHTFAPGEHRVTAALAEHLLSTYPKQFIKPGSGVVTPGSGIEAPGKAVMPEAPAKR